MTTGLTSNIYIRTMIILTIEKHTYLHDTQTHFLDLQLIKLES